MPSSLHAQMTRRAISPRFAIRIFLNIQIIWSDQCGESRLGCPPGAARPFTAPPQTQKGARGCAPGFTEVLAQLHFFALMANNSCPYSIGWPLLPSFFTI